MKNLIWIIALILFSCKTSSIIPHKDISFVVDSIKTYSILSTTHADVVEFRKNKTMNVGMYSVERIVDTISRPIVGSELLVSNPKIKAIIIDNAPTILNDTINGIIVYSIPDNMKIGKLYTIRLRISKDKNKTEMIVGDRHIPINDTSIKSTITIESVRVESIMSAQLLSIDGKIEIKPQSTEFQNIEKSGYTEWEWSVKPIKSGNCVLKLLVKVRIKDSGDFFKDITVFDRKIEIKPDIVYTIINFLKNYWQWIMTSIIIPIIVYVYKRRKIIFKKFYKI